METTFASLKNRKKIITSFITIISFSDIIGKILELAKNKVSSYICIFNVHMAIEAYRDKNFSDVVNNAYLVTADGMPIVKAVKFLYGIKQDRIAGMDLINDVVSLSANNRLSILFFGSTQEVLKTISQKIKSGFPGIKAEYFSPSFGSIDDLTNHEILRKINDFNPHIVLVALGCPKQEIWMAKMKGKINAVMIGVGAAFPVYAGIQKRAPLWMREYALEWLFRLFQDPKRLWKRYLITNSLFIYLFLKQKFFIQKPILEI